MRAKPSPVLAFDLRVTLRFIAPEIWRLVRVPHDIRMDRLHAVLQVAFGWTDSHLHQFLLFDAAGKVKGYVGQPDPDSPSVFLGRRPPTQDETKRLLKNLVAKPGDRLDYEYDFGDGWRHEITVAAVHEQTSRLAAALCLDGARAGPPEDCGGPPGYEERLAALANPKDPMRAETQDWLGDFDPEAFALAATNRVLLRCRV